MKLSSRDLLEMEMAGGLVNFERLDAAYHVAHETTTAQTLLDRLARCKPGEEAEMLFKIHTQLRHERERVPDWKKHVADIQTSRGHDVIMHSPLSGRCYRKPRGYAGDAVMIDAIYQIDTLPSPFPAGQRTYEWELLSAASRSVRARRVHLAKLIDTAAPGSRVLSVACGHLREAQLSTAVAGGTLEELVGFDQDQESIERIKQSSYDKVTPVVGSVRQILTTSVELGTFDVIYSAGLYDYLSHRVASALTAKLVAMLRPGGKLHIANFTPDLPDIPYMEAIMDWWLIYRSLDEMQRLADGLEGVVVSATSMSVPNGLNSVAWLTIERLLQ